MNIEVPRPSAFAAVRLISHEFCPALALLFAAPRHDPAARASFAGIRPAPPPHVCVAGFRGQVFRPGALARRRRVLHHRRTFRRRERRAGHRSLSDCYRKTRSSRLRRPSSFRPATKAPLAFENYAWSKDKSRLLLYTNSAQVWRQHTRGDYWVLDLKSGALRKLGGDAPASSLMFAKFSPDGSKVAYVRANNIYVEEISTANASLSSLTTARKPSSTALPTGFTKRNWIFATHSAGVPTAATSPTGNSTPATSEFSNCSTISARPRKLSLAFLIPASACIPRS